MHSKVEWQQPKETDKDQSLFWQVLLFKAAPAWQCQTLHGAAAELCWELLGWLDLHRVPRPCPGPRQGSFCQPGDLCVCKTQTSR